MMNENIENIIFFQKKLETIKTTHPNLYKLWSSYLDEKIKSLNKAITKANVMLEYTKNKRDLTKDEILTTYYIKNHLN